MSTWVCEVCSEQNEANAEWCDSCGAAKPKVTMRRVQQPRQPTPDPTRAFVVHPERRDIMFGNRDTLKPTGGYGAYGLVLGAVAIALALILLGAEAMIDQIQLRVNGEQIEGVIYETNPDETTVAYEFNPSLYYQRLQPVSQDFYDNTPLNSSVTVVYEPDNPTNSQIKDQSTAVIPNGIEAQAVVYEKVPDETALRYEFQAGIFYQRQQTVSEDFFATAAVGDTVTVLYDPGDPFNNEIKGEPARLGRLMAPIAGVALFALALMLSPVVFAGRTKKLALYKDADLIAGTITAVGQRSDAQGNLNLALEYRFQSPRSGRNLTQRVVVQRNDLKVGGMPEAGDTVSILYAGDNNYEVV